MERRFCLGLALLILLLVLSLGTAWGMKTIHAPEEAALSEAAALALEGNMAQAVPLAKAAYDRWETYREVTASLADHSPMDETEMLFQEMLVYAQAREVPHFAACCAQLSAMTKAMYDAHSPAFQNLL